MGPSSNKSKAVQTLPGQMVLALDALNAYADPGHPFIPGACVPQETSDENATTSTRSKQRKPSKKKKADHPGQLELDLAVLLKTPILSALSFPKGGSSAGRKRTALEKAECDSSAGATQEEGLEIYGLPDIPYEPWGPAWVTDSAGYGWSMAAVHYFQIQLFWDSLEELTLSNNEREKWDVLKWIFKPAIRRFYVFGKPPVVWHENDEAFSFHNVCMTVRVDEDVIRDGIRRAANPEIMKAIDRVFAY